MTSSDEETLDQGQDAPVPEVPETQEAREARWKVPHHILRQKRAVTQRMRRKLYKGRAFNARIGQHGPRYRKPTAKDGLRCCQVCSNLEVLDVWEPGEYPWGEMKPTKVKYVCIIGVTQPRLRWVCSFWNPLNEQIEARMQIWDDKHLKARHRFIQK